MTNDRIDWLSRHTNYGRVTAGLVCYLAPHHAARAMGLDASSSADRDYLARLFGAREVALGLSYLLSSGDRRRKVQRLSLMIDLLDTAAGAGAGVAGSLRPRTAAYVSAVSAAAAVVGLAALLRDLRQAS